MPDNPETTGAAESLAALRALAGGPTPLVTVQKGTRPPVPDHVPQYRPAGSPLAESFGATNHDGSPDLSVPRRPVVKAVSQHPGVHRDLQAMSPNDRAAAEVAKAEMAQTLKALRQAFSPGRAAHPGRRTPVRKADKTAEGMVAVYDASGNLMGLVDPDSMQQLVAPPTAGSSAGLPPADVVQAQSPPSNGGGGTPAATPAAVQKSRLRARRNPDGSIMTVADAQRAKRGLPPLKKTPVKKSKIPPPPTTAPRRRVQNEAGGFYFVPIAQRRTR